MTSTADLLHRSDELLKRSRNIHERIHAIDELLFRTYPRSLTAEEFAKALFANANVEVCRTVQFPIAKIGNL